MVDTKGKSTINPKTKAPKVSFFGMTTDTTSVDCLLIDSNLMC